MKVCGSCEVSKALAEFSVRRASPDGLSCKCIECSKSYAKQRYATNPKVRERIKSKAKDWAARNPDKVVAIKTKSALKNAAAKNAKGKVYAKLKRQNNLESARLFGRVAAQRRRHRMAGNNSFIHSGLAKRLLDLSGGVCSYCHQQAKMTLDHFQPVSKGGGGEASNLFACCMSCNSSKKDADGPTWIHKKFGLDRLADVCRLAEKKSSARLP